ncbi:zinc finger protein with KRAB and SCAN domains 1-like [Palaemon carinicauda]|uniref:zinc finger protein with KRAB and SCAN domains 1-like n=1 Tax=Palaemon carinicauda TaxID=392227 RepID=UPI0035B67B6D
MISPPESGGESVLGEFKSFTVKSQSKEDDTETHLFVTTFKEENCFFPSNKVEIKTEKIQTYEENGEESTREDADPAKFLREGTLSGKEKGQPLLSDNISDEVKEDMYLESGKVLTSSNEQPPAEKGHRKENQFVCDVCGKRFSYKCNLKNHLMLHTGDKPFRCKECGKRFRQKGHLVGPKRRAHTGEKPFFLPPSVAKASL